MGLGFGLGFGFGFGLGLGQDRQVEGVKGLVSTTLRRAALCLSVCLSVCLSEAHLLLAVGCVPEGLVRAVELRLAPQLHVGPG